MTSPESENNYDLLTITSKSRKKLLIKFKKLDEINAKHFYFNILKSIKEVVCDDNVNSLKNLCWLLEDISRIKKENDLQNYHKDRVENFNLVALACQKKACKVLEYLFSKRGKFLYNLIISICQKDHLLSDYDEYHHNSFYYAIHSNLVGLLRILVEKWLNDRNIEQLEDFLSKEYRKLKLRRVSLTNEIELYVQNKVLDIRFFQEIAKSNKGSGNSGCHIQKRIEMVIQDIHFVKFHYWNDDPDERFLLKAEFIAKNIHVLKSILKSTYDKLPWEEIEFCLVVFIRCCKNRLEANLVYNSVLNKKKLLLHLENFSMALECESRAIQNFDVVQLAKPVERARSKRKNVVEKITENYSFFQELYNNYEKIRDFCSLETIKTYIDLAVSVDVTQKEGQLVVTRALQVMGEHLKNTIESPKLSDSMGKILLSSLPSNTRDVITSLRDSLSHDAEREDNTHFILTVIEKKPQFFFKNVQQDISKIHVVIVDTLYKIKIGVIQKLMKQIGSCKQLNDVRDFFGPFRLSITSFASEVDLDIAVVGDLGQLEELLSSLSSIMLNKTSYERGLFEQINSLIQKEKERLYSVREAFLYNTFRLGDIFDVSQTSNASQMNYIHWLSKRFKKPKSEELILSEELPTYEEIVSKLLKQIVDSAKLKIKMNYDAHTILLKIVNFIKFEKGNIKWIKEFKGTSDRKKKKKAKNVINTPSPKQSQLKSVLNNNNLVGSSLVTNISFFNSDAELQTAIEMLVLDVLSILEDSCNRNSFFLDSEYPLLIGKNLRNHLAHNNALINVVLDKSPVQLLTNAVKLASEDFSKDDKKIDKIILCDSSVLEKNHADDVSVVDNQQNLFYALENGDLERVQECLKKGADIFGKDLFGKTCLHFSAKASNIEAIKLVLQQGLDVASKDLDEQTALHVAAKHDRINIVKYLINTKLMCINECDIHGKTPLHLAIDGNSKKTVKYLLKREANMAIKDTSGLSPLHCAILRNNCKIAEFLLEKETNIGNNLSPGGYSALHRAAEKGQTGLVIMLIKKIDLGLKTDFGVTPLHVAADNGHLEVVKALIRSGADVNARTVSDSTPLHSAIQSGDEEIVECLLRHGAEVNASMLNLSLPLSHAAEEGRVTIAKLLLRYGAVVDLNTDLGQTPLQFAAQNGHFDFVNLLLEQGAIVNKKNKKNDNGTALHYSSGNGHSEVVKLLIQHDADIEAKDFNDSTPLHVAVEQGHEEVVKILIDQGVDVRSKDALGSTALFIAACHGHKAIVQLLLSSGADIKAEDKNKITPMHILLSNELSELLIQSNTNIDFVDAYGCTALHLGALNGNLDFVKYCLQNGCSVDARNTSGLTALHLAVQGNHQEVVSHLIDYGADTNAKSNGGHTALQFAAQNNCTTITSILIRNTDLADQIESLLSAVFEGHHDIVNTLLKKCAFNVHELQEKYNLLHKAVENGHLTVVKILLDNGFEVNAMGKDSTTTPLHCAAVHEHWEIAQLLLTKGANPNAQDLHGITPIHISVMRGNVDLFEILLEEKADIFLRDHRNNSAVELTIYCSRLDILKLLLQTGKAGVNFKGYLNRTLLHESALSGTLEITEYLVENGADIDARCTNGHKPIHLASEMGFEKIVEFYLNHNMSVNNLNGNKLTLLHIAADCGKANVAELLIKRKANINIPDINNETPLHLAVANGHKEVLDILLHYGAYYNIKNKLKQTPLEITNNETIALVLRKIETLFIALEHNDPLEVEIQLNEATKNSEFCFINANCVRNDTLLHYASRNGHERAVEALLKHKANPNILNKDKRTPLHYAAELSHFGIVKILLSKGAIYNAVSSSHKTPLKCAVDQNIISLFDFLNKAFAKVRSNNVSLLQELEKMKDFSKVKAIMGAKNLEGRTLIEVAILCNFSNSEQLKELFQSDTANSLELADVFIRQEKLTEALCAYERVIKIRTEIFGPDNPSVLDVQERLIRLLNIQQNYGESLQLLEEIYQKRHDAFGANHKETLAVKALKAVTLFQQGMNEEALRIFKEVVPRQKEILEPNDSGLLDSESGMAAVLLEMEKYAEASKINHEILEKSIETFGTLNVVNIVAYNNLGKALNKQEKHGEALKMFKKSYEISKCLFTLHHSDTLRVLFNIASTLGFLKKYDESLNILRELLDIQMVRLPPNHFDILTTEFHIGTTLDFQGMTITALRIFLNLKPRINSFCPNTILVNANKRKIDGISLLLKMFGIEEVLERIRNEVKHASNDEKCSTKELSCMEEDIDYQGVNGITALHVAVVNGNKNRINVLLEKGFDVLKVTMDGNTALHTAAINGYADIAEIILKNTEQHNRPLLNELINARNAGTCSTALHIAANADTATCLLKYGAVFDVKNKLDQTPLDLAKDKKVFTLLKTIGEMFDSTEKGMGCVIDRVRELDSKEALAALHARNSHGSTLLLVALTNKHKYLAKELSEFLKNLMKMT
ncbi:ankyrin-3 [Trichonephila clavipes]|nr:ankyrin-3 [Trichonephila clavipes]